MRESLLLVEDEPSLASGLKLNFELEGYRVCCASTGAAAREAFRAERPSLVLLDLMLPDDDGLHLLQEFKREAPRLPVLVLTALSSDADRIGGLSRGADDYVTKPFVLQELVLRVRALLRRSAWSEPPPAGEIRIGEAFLRPGQSRLDRSGASQLLTELELALLLYLWKRRGEWVTREELLVDVWGYAAETNTRTVDIFVSRLRRMLGDDAQDPRMLLTKRGKGYMLSVG